MSVNDQMSDMDKAFKAYAEQIEKEAAAKKSTGSSSDYEFEKKKWVGLVPNEHRILRLLGGIPNSNADEFTARVVRKAKIISDDNKGKIFYLPTRDDPDFNSHILWKIINKVNEVAWINKKKHFINENLHPEIFNLINFNGLEVGNKTRIYDKGWSGQEILLFNVIDRENIQWHKENKHSALLAKNINITDDGSEYVDEGVSSYSFLGALLQVIKVYGDFNKWDVSVVRTGNKDQPFIIKNATKYVNSGIPEIPEDKAEFVSLTPLTDEEASWTKYDLKSSYGLSKYAKIYNSLKGKIKKIDVALNTKFLEELIELVEVEKAQTAANSTPEVSIVVTDPIQAKTQETPKAAPVRTRTSTHSTSTEVEDFEKPKFWNLLTEVEKSIVTGSTADKNGTVSLIYDTSDEIVACDKCGSDSPLTFHACPSCGETF